MPLLGPLRSSDLVQDATDEPDGQARSLNDERLAPGALPGGRRRRLTPADEKFETRWGGGEGRTLELALVRGRAGQGQQCQQAGR